MELEEALGEIEKLQNEVRYSQATQPNISESQEDDILKMTGSQRNNMPLIKMDSTQRRPPIQPKVRD